jgi:AraC-like DNA-binding protein
MFATACHARRMRSGSSLVIDERLTESEGGRCLSAHLTPPPALARYLDALWYSEGTLAASRERVLPSGLVDVVANLGPPMALAEGRGLRVITGGCSSGVLARPEVIEHPAVHRAVGMRLRPLGARLLLGVPLSLFSGTLTALDDLLGAPGAALAARCGNAPTPAAALGEALAWVEERLHTAILPDALAPWALARLDAAGGPLAIADLARRSGLSERRFVVRFHREIGVTPKVYTRLVRFRRTLAALGPDLSLAALASSMDFADQPHMNREFRDLAGLTPSAVLRGRYESGLTVAEAGLSRGE